MSRATWTGGTKPLKGTVLPRGMSDYEDKLREDEHRFRPDGSETVVIARDSEIQR